MAYIDVTNEYNGQTDHFGIPKHEAGSKIRLSKKEIDKLLPEPGAIIGRDFHYDFANKVQYLFLLKIKDRYLEALDNVFTDSPDNTEPKGILK